MNSKTLLDKINHKIKEIAIDFENETFLLILGNDVRVNGTFKTEVVTIGAGLHFVVNVLVPTKGNPYMLCRKAQSIISNRIIEEAGNVLHKVMPKTKLL